MRVPRDESPDGVTDRLFKVEHDLTTEAGVDHDWGVKHFGNDLSLCLVLTRHGLDLKGITALQQLAIHARNVGHSLQVVCMHRYVYQMLRSAGLADIIDDLRMSPAVEQQFGK